MHINNLKIFTTNLSSIENFYGNILGLILKDKTATSLSFQIGHSILTIEKRLTATPYHFAINVPCNQIKEAHQWLKERVSILKDGDNEIQHFDFWNANAVYFYDPDQNILELIGRNKLNNPSDIPFSVKSLLEISEIGLVVDDIESTFKQLQQECRLPQYSGNMDDFCTIGGEHGLFICINGNKRDWYPRSDKAFPSPFEVDILVEQRAYVVSYQDKKLSVRSLDR